MKILNKFVAVIALLAVTTSCQKNLSSATYVDSSTAGVVLEGVIVSARPVTVKSSDQLGKGGSGAGMLGGAALGGIGGSQIGKGKGSAAGTVGGAIAGAVLGAVIEDQLNTQTGMEYLVKLNADNIDDSKTVTRSSTINRNPTVTAKMVGTTKVAGKSKIISVVQGIDNPLQVGQKCYVVYNDDRPRVIPAF